MNVVVAGAGGFIGGYLVNFLISKGHSVTALDIKKLDQWHQINSQSKNIQADMRLRENWFTFLEGADRVYNLACNMGGMGFIQNNHSLCMESVLIQAHCLIAAKDLGVKQVLYSSSACVYPLELQSSIKNSQSQALKESDAIPANPEDGYGWEKLFSEIMTQYFAKDFSLDVRICRYHNVYGPYGTFSGGREKAPAALCRKIAEASIFNKNEIEIWGDGNQTRSFMYIDDCITGMDLIWQQGFTKPLNLGSSEMVSINQLVDIIESIEGKKFKRVYRLDCPQGVRGRNSDNSLVKKVLNWEPSTSLRYGIQATYDWIKGEILKQNAVRR